ncbi:MAG: PRC-barrel domain-containing protein, partial [Rhodobacteraceae bacterium]|nr:PRC-barrel domain-containing protein [Paracoccaceae bacterium]
GYVVVSPEVVVAADIEGQPVYDMENNRIGEVASVETGASGQVEAATIEIGGFLGIGEAEVDVAATEMGVVRNDKSDVRVYVAATEDELEQRAEMSNS